MNIRVGQSDRGQGGSCLHHPGKEKNIAPSTNMILVSVFSSNFPPESKQENIFQNVDVSISVRFC